MSAHFSFCRVEEKVCRMRACFLACCATHAPGPQRLHVVPAKFLLRITAAAAAACLFSILKLFPFSMFSCHFVKPYTSIHVAMLAIHMPSFLVAWALSLFMRAFSQCVMPHTKMPPTSSYFTMLPHEEEPGIVEKDTTHMR